MKLRATLPLALVAISVLAYAAQGIDLKWTPKVGDKATYKVKGTFELGGMGEAVLAGTRSEEITEIKDGNVVAVANTKMTANAGGTEFPIPDAKETTKSKLDGTVLEVSVDEKQAGTAGLRLGRVTAFVFPGKPVAIGDTWTAEEKKDEKQDLPGYKVEFKLVGEEKVGAWDTYKVTSKGGETEGDAPTKVEATFWVEKSTGNMVHSLSNLKDAVVDQFTLSGTMDIVRQP